MADLVAARDRDVSAYGDVGSYFLRAAGEVVRSHCGWHIYPSITVTDQTLPVGSYGLVLLPSAYVTDMASVSVDGKLLFEDLDYRWDPRGWIEIPGMFRGYAVVSYTHGYAELPLDIKSVVCELAANVAAIPSGVEDVATPGYRIAFGDELGLTLTDSMRSRLANYRLWTA